MTGLSWAGTVGLEIVRMDAGEARAVDKRASDNRLMLRVLTTEEDGTWQDDSENRLCNRIENKLDLLLSVLASQSEVGWERYEVELEPKGVRVYGVTATAVSSRWQLAFFFKSEQPLPITLEGVASEVADHREWVYFSFLELEGEEAELLERFIFQQHRRAVAAARRGRD